MGSSYPTDGHASKDYDPDVDLSDDLPEPTGKLGRSFGERLLTRLAPWFYPMYLALFANRREFVRDIETELDEANVPLSAEVTLSGSLGIGFIFGFPIALLLGVIAYPLPDLNLTGLSGLLARLVEAWNVVEPIVETPLVFAFALSVGICLGIVSVYLGGRLYLRTTIGARKRKINLLLADAVAYLHAQSDGGMGPPQLIESMADSQNSYSEVAVEFSRIQQRIELGESYQTAIGEVANVTPSEELAQFLNDMLSVINSGGDMTYFLDQQRDQRVSALQQAQESRLDLLEMLGQFHLTGSMTPMFILIIIVVQSLLGSPRPWVLAGTVYLIIPGISILFLAAVSTLKHDDPGSGYLETEYANLSLSEDVSPFSLGIVGEFTEKYDDPLFQQVRRQEIRNRIGQFLDSPLAIFRVRPQTTLYVTIPLATITLLLLYFSGTIGPSIGSLQEQGITAFRSAWVERPIGQTVGWFLCPAYIVLLPLGYYYERQARKQEGITTTLTQELRKISNHNDSGRSVLPSIRRASDSGNNQLANELGQVYKRVEYGEALSTGLIRMNNKYCQPRLARMIQLVERAQRTSNHISDILRNATKLSETREQLDAEYESRMQTQLIVLSVTFLVFLGVLLFLRVMFLPTIADLVTNNDQTSKLIGASANLPFVNLMFFHGALLQGIMTGVLIGYVQHNDLYRGIKWVLVFSTLTVVLWALVGVFA